jgi:hypothetical protein
MSRVYEKKEENPAYFFLLWRTAIAGDRSRQKHRPMRGGVLKI